MYKWSLWLLGTLTGIVVVAVLFVLLTDNDRCHFVLRPAGCQAASQLGLNPSPLPGGCEVIGNLDRATLNWIRIDGVMISNREVVAFQKVR